MQLTDVVTGRMKCGRGLKTLNLSELFDFFDAALQIRRSATHADTKKPPPGRFFCIWRRERDSNPRYVAVYTLSRRAPSATRTPLLYKPRIVRERGRRVNDFTNTMIID